MIKDSSKVTLEDLTDVTYLVGGISILIFNLGDRKYRGVGKSGFTVVSM